MKPVAAIYSTFLQRAFDQIVHDVCLQNLNVVFAMDRAGLVGDDGPTHHGAFDIAYLRALPNIVLMAPRDEAMLVNMLRTATTYDGGPIALRYPRGEAEGVAIPARPKPIEMGRGELLREGERVALLGYGLGVSLALGAAYALEQSGEGVGLGLRQVDEQFCEALGHQRRRRPKSPRAVTGEREPATAPVVLGGVALHQAGVIQRRHQLGHSGSGYAGPARELCDR